MPKIMEVIAARLTQAYVHLNESQPGVPVLRRLSGLVNKVNEINRMVSRPYIG